jgi:5-methylcytosine-specific restriction endonuclease McrA
MATATECLESIRKAAEHIGTSPTKRQYEELGFTPSSTTILRIVGGWNEAKRRAGLEVYDPGEFGGVKPLPKPDGVELPDDTEWSALTGYQRWYYRNREQVIADREIRRHRLKRWFFEYKRDECACARCGESHPGCLDFHHVNPTRKEVGVSELVNRGHSRKRVLAEIEKCMVLCSNCHRKEHYDPPVEPTTD